MEFHTTDKFKIHLKSSFNVSTVRDVVIFLLSVLGQEPLMPEGLTFH